MSPGTRTPPHRRRRRRRRPPAIRFGALLAAAAVLLALPLAATAAAQEDDPLDAVRDAIPEGEPGEWDEQDGLETYQQLAVLYGEDTIIEGVGDGSELRGQCGGFAVSYDEDGEIIDGAFDAGDDAPPVDLVGDDAGGQAFTAANRFQVDTNGVVAYFGFMPFEGDGPENHSWEITVEGISLDRGGDPNGGLNNRNAGIVDLANDLPGWLKTNFTARVEGTMDTTNGLFCEGYGHVEFSGPFLNVVSATGLAFLGAGVIGLLFNARPARTWRA